MLGRDENTYSILIRKPGAKNDLGSKGIDDRIINGG
jgi:hypothetical protein